MDGVKVLAFSTCVSIVIGALLSMIAPNIEKIKVLRIMLSAFILIGMLSPIPQLINKNNFLDRISFSDYSEYQQQDYQTNTLQAIEDNASLNLYPIIKDNLSDLGYNNEFGLDLGISVENHAIKIEYVNISIWDLHSIEKEEIKAHLIKETGLPINIVEKEGEVG